MINLFCIRYNSSQRGCPPFLSGAFNHPEFEWEPLDPHAADAVIDKQYEFQSKISDVHFDFYGSLRIVSAEFLAVCDNSNVRYRPVPLLLRLPDGTAPSKHYFLILLRDHVSALDRQRSRFIDAKDPRTGELLPNRLYPGHSMYDSIESFVPVETIFPNLFVCIETGELFCTEVFKRDAELRRLSGIRFQKIDDSYRYNPFADL